MLTLSRELLIENNACQDGLAEYDRLFPTADPVPLLRVVQAIQPKWGVWCLRACMPEQADERNRVARLLACRCAERVALTIPDCPFKTTTLAFIEQIRRFADGTIDRLVLDQLRTAYQSAYWTAYQSAYWTAYQSAYWAADQSAYWAADQSAYQSADQAACWAACWQQTRRDLIELLA